MHITHLTMLLATLGSPVDLDEIVGEWIADDVSVSREVILEPTSLGYAFVENTGGQAQIGCQAFFINEGGQEHWRVVLCFADAIVVYDEGMEEEVYPVGNPDYAVIYSRNGRFALVSEESNGKDSITLIDFSTASTSSAVVPTSDKWLANDGSVMCWASSNSPMAGFSGDTLVFLDSTLRETGFLDVDDTIMQRIAYSPGGGLAFFEDLSGLPGPHHVGIVDTGASVRWRQEVSSSFSRPAEFIDGDNGLLLCLGVHGIVIYDALTGEVQERLMDGTTTAWPHASPSGSTWVCTTIGEYGSDSHRDVHLVGSESGDPMTVGRLVEFRNQAYGWNAPHAVRLTDSGYCLLLSERRGDPEDLRRFMLVSPEGRLLWVSEPISVSRSSFSVAPPNSDTASRYRLIATALSEQGNSLVLCDLNRILLVTFGGALR